MIKLTKYCLIVLIYLIFNQVNAQDSIFKKDKAKIISQLETDKIEFVEQEKKALVQKIEAINQRLKNNEITQKNADIEKKKQSENHAANVKKRIAIINNKIALHQRDYAYFKEADSSAKFNISLTNIANFKLNNRRKRMVKKNDIRTYNHVLVAFGFNNAIAEGQSFNKTPFENLGSRFIELGWNWKTRLLKNSNWARVKYGVAFQWNKLKLKDDQFFVQEGNNTSIEKFSVHLKKSEFTTTNLVVPIYFEFGPYTKIKKNKRVRYYTWNKLKFGIGGHAGVRISSQQKLKYKEDGKRVNQKTRRNYNASNFIYGIGAYVGIGEIALYAKYDLNPIFKNQDTDLNNISLGLRFDID